MLKRLGNGMSHEITQTERRVCVDRYNRNIGSES